MFTYSVHLKFYLFLLHFYLSILHIYSVIPVHTYFINVIFHFFYLHLILKGWCEMNLYKYPIYKSMLPNIDNDQNSCHYRCSLFTVTTNKIWTSEITAVIFLE